MKNTNEMITAIETTFKKVGHPLTESQSAILAGCLFIWFDAVREDERTAQNQQTQEFIIFKLEKTDKGYSLLLGPEDGDPWLSADTDELPSLKTPKIGDIVKVQLPRILSISI